VRVDARESLDRLDYALRHENQITVNLLQREILDNKCQQAAKVQNLVRRGS
jgi:hypothetical protein